MEFISDISGKHKMSPDNESLSPYLEGLSPVSNEVSPMHIQESSIKSTTSGDTEILETFSITMEGY